MKNIAAWIMASGIVFGLGLFLIAVLESDPWRDHNYTAVTPIPVGAPSPHPDDRVHMVCSSCHEIIFNEAAGRTAVVPPIAPGDPAPHRNGWERQACSNCHRILTPMEVIDRVEQQESVRPLISKPQPVILQAAYNRGTPVPPIISGQPAPHSNGWERQDCALCHEILPRQKTAAPAVVLPPADGQQPLPAAPILGREDHERYKSTRFQGKVVRIVGQSKNTSRKNVNILVDNGVSAPIWYNIAPRTVLQSMGCNFGIGMFVKGTAYKEKRGAETALRYGRSISVNGKTCQLRNSHLVGSWEPGGMKDHDQE